MEIHPPDHALHTWRDFFTHMATICLGLLIAIGLEQSVEALNHHHQLNQLRAALRSDAEKVVREAPLSYRYLRAESDWYGVREDQVLQAIQQHHPIPTPPPLPTLRPNPAPFEPAWTAALASGQLSLMPQAEVRIYAEVDSNFKDLVMLGQETGPYSEQASFERSFCGKACDDSSFAHASEADLRRYIALLHAVRMQEFYMAVSLRAIYNAENAILHGERNLEAIQAAENRPMPATGSAAP